MFAAGAWPGAVAADSSPARAVAKPIRFVSVNDFHHEEEACDAWMEALFRQIAATEGAAFCLGLGDLANTGKLTSLESIKRLSSHLGMPFHPSPGNHDLDQSPVDGYYEKVFPGKRNHVVLHEGWQIVLIDSTEGVKWRDTTISKETLDWLDQILPTLDPHAPLVLATHFPLLSRVSYCPLNADAVLARFIGHNLRGVFGGHFHGITANQRGDMALRTCACVARVRPNHDNTPDKGYYVVDGDASGKLVSTFVKFNGIQVD